MSLISIKCAFTLFITIMFGTKVVFVYCSVVYPVAWGVPWGRRGGGVEHDDRTRGPPAGEVLYLLEHGLVEAVPVAPPLDHGDEEEDDPAERDGPPRDVERGGVRLEHVVEPTWKKFSVKTISIEWMIGTVPEFEVWLSLYILLIEAPCRLCLSFVVSNWIEGFISKSTEGFLIQFSLLNRRANYNYKNFVKANL